MFYNVNFVLLVFISIFCFEIWLLVLGTTFSPETTPAPYGPGQPYALFIPLKINKFFSFAMICVDWVCLIRQCTL